MPVNKSELVFWKIGNHVDESWINLVASAKSLDREQSWPSADHGYEENPVREAEPPNQVKPSPDGRSTEWQAK